MTQLQCPGQVLHSSCGRRAAGRQREGLTEPSRPLPCDTELFQAMSMGLSDGLKSVKGKSD